MCSQLLEEVEEEVTDLLTDLIRINTTNPPGNETEAAKYLARTLEKEGCECELFEPITGRGNMVTRLIGSGERPSLLLLSHMDVVPANPGEWSVDPFAGIVKDGFVWGRGALDMKSMTAMEIMTVKLLKRKHLKLKGDLMLAATADEEKNGDAGVGWLVCNHPEKIRADYVINEGGGLAIPIHDKNIFTVQTAEKGILWFKVRAKGRSGHASIPGMADNAIQRMNRVIEKLGNYRQEISLVPTVKQFLGEIAKESQDMQQALQLLLKNPSMGDQILDDLAKKDRNIAEEIRARIRMTIAPTVIQGGVKENVIPSECEAIFDCRILPGQTCTEAMEEIRGLLDADIGELEFEIIQAVNGSESPANTPLYEDIMYVLKEFEPDCSVVPILLTGGTDSQFLRKLGSVCYGFQPLRADIPYGEILRTKHGVDERISLKNLVFGTSVLYNIVERFMT